MSTVKAIEGEFLPAVVGRMPKRRRFALTTVRGVRKELAGLYAELRNNEVDMEKAKAAAYILRCILEALRLDEIERRLIGLEHGER